jgi:type 1 glutamine amidotransferase
MKKALFAWGGWDGHTPRECVDVFAPWLVEQGYEVDVSDTLGALGDAERLGTLSLIVPVWTLGELTAEQEKTLCEAVASGVGIVGWHGGACDAFRASTQYQFMMGGQFVAHPGDLLPAWDVKIVDREHEITRGISDFTMRDTERYYLHVDPSNHVLAVTRFEGGFDMPVVWTRAWGAGRVAVASFGHTFKDFDVPPAREIVQRAMLWASR